MSDALKGATIALLNAVLALLLAFGVSLTSGQQAAIVGFANSIIIVLMVLQHKKVVAGDVPAG